MEIFIGEQLKNIGYSFILGLIFGGFYDIICIMHIIIGVVSDSGDKVSRTDIPARILFFITDIFFMLAVTVMMSVFLYEFASGEFRGYFLASAAVGFAVYRYTLGRIVSAVSESVVHLLRRWIHMFVVRPVCFVLKWLGRLVNRLYCRTIQVLIGYVRIMYQERYLRYTKKRLAQEIHMGQRR